MSKYWRINKQSAPTLGVKTLMPNSHLICRFNGQKMDETHFRHVSGKRGMRCVTLTPYVQSTPILILFDSAPLRDTTTFLPKMDSKWRKWIKNEVSKIPCVHTSFKHQISPPIHNLTPLRFQFRTNDRKPFGHSWPKWAQNIPRGAGRLSNWPQSHHPSWHTILTDLCQISCKISVFMSKSTFAPMGTREQD